MTPVPVTVTTPAALTAAIKACATAKAALCALALTGTWPAFQIYNPPILISINAKLATFTGTVALNNVTGLQWVGGFLNPVAPSHIGMFITNSTNVDLGWAKCTNPSQACVSVTRSNHIGVHDVWVNGSGGDGVDIAGSQFVTAQRIYCEAFAPLNGLHPDCVQGWTIQATANAPMNQTTDVTIDSSVAVGAMQGFDFWDHDPAQGSKRITISNNVAVGGMNCVGLLNSTDSFVTGNRCYTTPQDHWWANLINLHNNINTVVSGNVPALTPPMTHDDCITLGCK